LLLAVNLKEQLLPGTFEWTINYLVGKMDIITFEKNYKNDELGAAAYSPRILLKAILYCYSKGIITSRKIEKACKENIIVKALAEESEPDHDTIATFISTNSDAISDLFTQVVLQCSQLGLIAGEMFAMDGCKLPSNASKEWSGTIKDLKKKRDKLKEYIKRMIKTHKELDNNKEAKERLNNFRQTMGDDKERRDKNIERLEKKLEKLNTFLETAKPRIGARGKELQSNVTDNESGRILSSHGYIQGYNGIAMADSANQVIVCADVVGSASESSEFPKMLGLLEENMEKATGKKKPLKDALGLPPVLWTAG
jgi:transposase